MMEAALQKERRERADAIRDALDQERGTSKMQKQLAEMRKELAISKEEARRAWEELGRREQEERDRTYSLQTGQPTIVGGVSVVPLTAGTARQPAARDRDPAYPHDAGPASPEQGQARHPSTSQGDYGRAEPAVDTHGNRVPQAAAPSSAYSGSDAEADDHDSPATATAMKPPGGGGGGGEPNASSADDAHWSGAYSAPQDYSGQGYGGPAWETAPRHHHPTRLSDVIEEEDERSRTSASQVSRG